MKFLDRFFSEDNSGIQFTRDQASHFAKDMAGDFNPIHDVDAKRFCVPGDLLFAVILNKYGASEKMCFNFSGMVTDGIVLNIDESDDKLVINDSKNKEYLSVGRHGKIFSDEEFIRNLTCSYVEFSGHTFPEILQPMMKAENAMINPARPLVIYEKMAIDLERSGSGVITLEMTDTIMEVNGKRGSAKLNFCIKDDGDVIGSGFKVFVMSGLKPYDDEAMETLVSDFFSYRDKYQAEQAQS
jgi:hypothetical protein